MPLRAFLLLISTVIAAAAGTLALTLSAGLPLAALGLVAVFGSLALVWLSRK